MPCSESCKAAAHCRVQLDESRQPLEDWHRPRLDVCVMHHNGSAPRECKTKLGLKCIQRLQTGMYLCCNCNCAVTPTPPSLPPPLRCPLETATPLWPLGTAVRGLTIPGLPSNNRGQQVMGALLLRLSLITARA